MYRELMKKLSRRCASATFKLPSADVMVTR